MSDQKLNTKIEAKCRWNTDPKIKYKMIVDFSQQVFLLDDNRTTARAFANEYSHVFQKRNGEPFDDEYILGVEIEINELLTKYRDTKKLFISSEVELKRDQQYPYNLPQGITVISRISIKNGVLTK